MNPSKVVDAHIHFWQLSRGDYTALEPHMTILLTDHLPEHLKPWLEKAGVNQIVVVEAAETFAESSFTLSLARKHPFIAGVVGWANLSSPDLESTLRALMQDPVYKGVRPCHNDNATIQWMKDPAYEPGFKTLINLGLSFDALVQNYRELDCVLSVAERFPDLTVILNHFGKPDVRRNVFAPWASDITRLAKHSNVLCKFSGLLNQAGVGWTLDQLRPYANHVLECFGPERLLWGSDWPPARLTAEYDVWWRVAHELLSHLPAGAQADIFGGNASRIYRL